MGRHRKYEPVQVGVKVAGYEILVLVDNSPPNSNDWVWEVQCLNCEDVSRVFGRTISRRRTERSEKYCKKCAPYNKKSAPALTADRVACLNWAQSARWV